MAVGTSMGDNFTVRLVSIEITLGEMVSNLLKGCYDSRQGALGPFSPSFDPNVWMREGMEKNLPEDAHLQANGRLHVSLTKVYDGQNILVSQFSSREELIQVSLHMDSCQLQFHPPGHSCLLLYPSLLRIFPATIQRNKGYR